MCSILCGKGSGLQTNIDQPLCNKFLCGLFVRFEIVWSRGRVYAVVGLTKVAGPYNHSVTICEVQSTVRIAPTLWDVAFRGDVGIHQKGESV